MAEGGSEDKKHAPTARRLAQAQEKGNVRRSQDFPRAAIIIAIIIAGLTAAGGLGGRLAADMAGCLAQAGTASLGAASGWEAAMLHDIAPLLLLLALLAVAASFASGGFVFTLNPLMPDFAALMPDRGLSQIFSTTGLIENAKNLLKVAVIGGAGGLMILLHHDEFAALAGPLRPDPETVLLLVLQVLGASGLAVLALGAGDLALQIWLHRRSLRMSDSEMREEMKDVAGNPHVKSQQRRLARKMARARQMQRIPEASVIVTNPTHYACAIRYQKGADRAPLLLAKGAGLQAEEIISRARAFGIPLVQAPPLARAVYRYVEPDEHVPVALYRACAEVLAYVWRLQAWRARGGERPQPPKPGSGEITVPGRRRVTED
ncbi:EscU/YscU/HrcU family type III secretion system export apparatus switch protein [Acidocella facilis]|uniref:EscU/YscU/HrcU family type III secretion system export apparatus switch protein n=1 Tax=Acidocella facilis TaxID=525 RepID=UPI0004789E31|nr:EscU/YscU/HrcU family type III secretion system export apparatus switch protein [Acidocella facilis]